jgi:hypothetical protein
MTQMKKQVVSSIYLNHIKVDQTKKIVESDNELSSFRRTLAGVSNPIESIEAVPVKEG